MSYDAIAAYFLTPAAEPIATPDVTQSPMRRLRDSVEAIATIGWWSRPSAEGFLGLGHGFFDGYVWGRAAALGDSVAPDVVVSAFGVFERSFLAGTYAHGRSLSSRDAILEARAVGASAGLRACCNESLKEDLATLADPVLSAVADLDCVARPLFSGLRSLPVPDDPWGKAWRAAELVREHRGDGHLAACATEGLAAVEMNVLTEVWLGYPIGEYSSTRGFSPDRIAEAAHTLTERGVLANDSLTDVGRELRDHIEDATDRSQAQLERSIDSNLDRIAAAANRITTAVLAAHAAPADPRKRAAG